MYLNGIALLRVEQGNRGVRIGGRIDDNAVIAAQRVLDCINQITLMV